MNPLWHIFWTYVLFRRKKYFKKTLLFSFIPDSVSLTVLGVAMLTAGTTHQAFKATYAKSFSGITEISVALHSISIACIVLIIVMLFQQWRLIPFFYGWVFHIILDTFTHASDNYPLLWPFSAYVFKSGLSYWEIEYHALPVNVINLVLASIVVVYVARDAHNKTFEVPFFVFMLLGTVASFLFIITDRRFLAPSFVIANIIMISALLYVIVKYRTHIKNYFKVATIERFK